VALERTSDLLSMASSSVIRFKLDTALPPDLAAQARVTGRIVQLPAPNAEAVEAILAQVRAHGGVAEQVEIRPADLEDVFISVMERG
jgi:ABC-2 type transport system ATP-binding protein